MKTLLPIALNGLAGVGDLTAPPWLRGPVSPGHTVFIVALLLASSAAFNAKASDPCPLFAPAVSYAAGAGVVSALVVNLNGDGRPDLVASAHAANSVSARLGNGDGTFGAAVTYQTAGPNAIAAGDFNLDGKVDLVVANSVSGSGYLSVLLGKGDGTFQSPSTFPSPGGVEVLSVAVGDLNHDGKLDLVFGIVGIATPALCVALGNGDGTFQTARLYGAGYWPHSIALGDFNSDGNTDSAVVDETSRLVWLLLGNGDGTFQTAVTLHAGLMPVFVVTGDFNLDGNADLAVADDPGLSGGVSVLLGNGNGTFQLGGGFSTGTRASAVAIGDLNGDGKPDLAVASVGASVLLGNGDGSFQAACNYTAGTGPSSIALDDFNGDAKLDLAVGNSQTANVSVLLAAMPPTISCPTNIVVNTDPGQCSAVVTYAVSSAGGSVTQLTGLPSGSAFPRGITTNSFSVTDTNGNTASCSFTVTVVDTQPPVILCASNKVVECGTAWSFDPPSAFDNCSATNVLISVVSTATNAGCGSTFTATRTWAAVDPFTNTAMCSQTVMVVDRTPPTIVCPPDITVEAQRTNGAVVPFVVTATDTCSAITLVVTPAAGSVFPIGVTTVQATAVDACTNASQCSFTVTVLGAQGVKSNVLAELIALRASTTLDESFAVKFDYAILHLQNSLNPAYWIDQTHLQPKGGNTALNEEKLAVNMLDVIMESARCPVDPAILQGFINRILKSDRLLAIISIQDAANAGLNAKKVAQDYAMVAKGDEEAAAGRYANAIEHYRNAWRHAIQLRLQVSVDAEGGTKVRFVGNNSKSYLIEVSTDLVNWVPLGTCKADAEGNVQFTDPNGGNQPLRFYRAVEQ